MIFKKALLLSLIFGILAVAAACSQVAATPAVIVETVVIKETVPVERVVKEVIRKEIEKVVTVEIDKEVLVFETVEIEKLVPVIETVKVIEFVNVEVMVTPTPNPTSTRTPIPTIDPTLPIVDEVLNRITMVQHHYNTEYRYDWFTCASSGRGLNGVEFDPNGPRFVGPNSMDFDLWGAVALFKVCPDGVIFLVPQQTGGKFVDPDGIEHESFTLGEALDLFAGGDARWIGAHGEAGRIGECDPQFVMLTPTPR